MRTYARSHLLHTTTHTKIHTLHTPLQPTSHSHTHITHSLTADITLSHTPHTPLQPTPHFHTHHTLPYSRHHTLSHTPHTHVSLFRCLWSYNSISVHNDLQKWRATLFSVFHIFLFKTPQFFRCTNTKKCIVIHMCNYICIYTYMNIYIYIYIYMYTKV